MEIQISSANMEISKEFPPKTVNVTTVWSCYGILGIHLKEYKSAYNSDIYPPVFIAALFTIAKLWNQTRCPSAKE
jgi:hypothetical protein